MWAEIKRQKRKNRNKEKGLWVALNREESVGLNPLLDHWSSSEPLPMLIPLPGVHLFYLAIHHLPQCMVSQVAIVIKNLPANAGDIKDEGSIPGLRRSPGGRHGNPLQYSCWRIQWTEEPGGLEFHWVAESQTRLKWLSIQHASSPKLM